MEGPGSVRAARERLAQAQYVHRSQQQEQQHAISTHLESQEFMVPRVQPDHFSPHWPLPIPNAHLPILGRTVYAPTSPNVDFQNLNKASITHNQSHGMKSVSTSSKSQDQSQNLRRTKDPRTLSQVTVSSLGTIPDFPVASIFEPLPADQGPPSHKSTQAPAAVHQQFPVVSPIVEEKGSRTSLRSYASSHAIPSIMTDFYFDDVLSDDESSPEPTKQPSEPPPALLRQASIGKRIGKPAMTSIKGRSKPLPIPAQVDGGPREATPSQLTNARHNPEKVNNYRQNVNYYVEDLEKGSDSDESLKRVPKSLLSDRVGNKRPPNLEFEPSKAKESGVRASLTSLPDLIKRATKLRSNLDHGRTASRLGFTNGWGQANMNVVFADKKEFGNDKSSDSVSEAHTDWPSGVSGSPMLTSHRGRYNLFKYSSGWCLNPARSKRSLMILVLLIIVLLTAAIVIPIVLIVIPKQHAAGPTSSSMSCQRNTTCTNGGIPLQLPNGNCECACVDGFLGAKCKPAARADCGTVEIEGGRTVSLGADIVPLFKSAESYNIPLNAQLLADSFQQSNMTCASGNDLVQLPSVTAMTGSSAQLSLNQAATTTNGIVVAGTPSATTRATSIGVSLPAITASPLTAGPVTNSSAQVFAKVGILFVMQDSRDLITASHAQQSLWSFLDSINKNGTNRAAATSVNLGNDYAINMWDFQIKGRNGTIYGN